MNSTYTASMFEKIKESLNKKNTNSGFKDILRFTKNNTYVVRLLPNIHDPDNTIFPYTTFGWTSLATGQYISVVSPITFGERCPLNELRFKLYQGSEREKELAKTIKRNNQWLVNCYVVNNPTAPETENQVKIIRFGKQLHKIIADAISGDDSEDFGPSIFDLSKNGNNLRIKVETNEGGYPTYISSKFIKAGSLPGITDEKSKEIYNSTFDLSKIIMVHSNEEIKKIIDVHLLKTSTHSVVDESSIDKPVEDEDDIPMGPSVPETSEEVAITDDEIDDLLKDL
jgi:hypothetical protein